MPRNMSFALTKDQFRARTKTVTRRFGWWHLKAGDIVMGIEKGMGLKKGEKVVKMGLIRIISTRTEPANLMHIDRYYGRREVVKEGFPSMTPSQFVRMLCDHNRKPYDEPVNRIEFEYLDED